MISPATKAAVRHVAVLVLAVAGPFQGQAAAEPSPLSDRDQCFAYLAAIAEDRATNPDADPLEAFATAFTLLEQPVDAEGVPLPPGVQIEPPPGRSTVMPEVHEIELSQSAEDAVTVWIQPDHKMLHYEARVGGTILFYGRLPEQVQDSLRFDYGSALSDPHAAPVAGRPDLARWVPGLPEFAVWLRMHRLRSLMSQVRGSVSKVTLNSTHKRDGTANPADAMRAEISDVAASLLPLVDSHLEAEAWMMLGKLGTDERYAADAMTLARDVNLSTEARAGVLAEFVYGGNGFSASHAVERDRIARVITLLYEERGTHLALEATNKLNHSIWRSPEQLQFVTPGAKTAEFIALQADLIAAGEVWIDHHLARLEPDADPAARAEPDEPRRIPAHRFAQEPTFDVREGLDGWSPSSYITRWELNRVTQRVLLAHQITAALDVERENVNAPLNTRAIDQINELHRGLYDQDAADKLEDVERWLRAHRAIDPQTISFEKADPASPNQ